MSTYCVRHITCVVLYYLISPMRWILLLFLILTGGGFPGGVVVINPPANAGDTRDMSSIPGSRRSPDAGNGNARQYSGLRNSMDRGALWTGCSLQACKELGVGHDWAAEHTHMLTDEETGLERVRSHPRSLGNCVIELGLSPDILDSTLIPSS